MSKSSNKLSNIVTGIMKSHIPNEGLPSIAYYADTLPAIQEKFVGIQAKILQEPSKINEHCLNCPTPIDKREEFGELGSKVSDDNNNFFLNPRADYLGTEYAGIVVVMGRPANPNYDKKYRGKRNKYNFDILNSSTYFMSSQSQEAWEELNEYLRIFIPRFVVSENVFSPQKWGFDIRHMAFLNVYKCYTKNKYKAHQDTNLINLHYCMKEYFIEQIKILEPKIIIFLSKEIMDASIPLLNKAGIHSYQADWMIEKETEPPCEKPQKKDDDIQNLIKDAMIQLGYYWRFEKNRMPLWRALITWNSEKTNWSQIKDPESFEIVVSDYARQYVKIFSDISTRTIYVSNLTERITPDTLRRNVREQLIISCRAYIFGLYDSAILACALKIEDALINHFGDNNRRYYEDKGLFKLLINKYFGEQSEIHKLRRYRNEIMHKGRHTSKEDCEELLESTIIGLIKIFTDEE